MVNGELLLTYLFWLMCRTYNGLLIGTGAKPEDHITGVGFIGMSGSTAEMNNAAYGNWKLVDFISDFHK